MHSAWGTFEWLIDDAFEQGYRVGIVANSDGHKGRPGASYPGATLFGAYGGLTCMLATELRREGIIDSLRRRHHYGTTGCRMILDVGARFDRPAELFADDPNLGPADSAPASKAMMGDILRWAGASACCGKAPSIAAAAGRRFWDGAAELKGNRFERVSPINFYNLDKTLDLHGPDRVTWRALTTGGFGGFDAWLTDPSAGTLEIDTALVKTTIAVADIGFEDTVFEAGGIKRQVRVFRLPDTNPHRRLSLQRRGKLHDDVDNALYVCLTQEDGHVVWSSPIYLFR